MRGKGTLLLALACIFGAAFSGAALAAPADEVKALLDQGKAAEAYAVGKKYPDQLGNPDFDFFYGVAAVDAGHAGEGVLALERYISNFPDNREARLELARGYFVLGDDARAREEFSNVLKTNPPPAVQANIQRFMDAIRSRESRYLTTAGFYAEAGLGYDTNVNGGVGTSTVTLPIFGIPTSVTLPPSGVKSADSFAFLGAGGNVTYPVAPGVALFGVVQGDTKRNRNDVAFSQDNANLAGGLSYLKDKNLWRATASYSELDMSFNDLRRTVAGATGEVNHQVDELRTVSGSLQMAQIHYTDPNDVRNANLRAASVGFRRAFIGNFQPLLSLTANFGEENNVRERPDLGRRFYGGRAAVAVTPAPRWSLSVGATYIKSKFGAVDPIFGVVHKDNYYGLDGALIYSLNRNWSLRGEYLYSKNNANIALYEYERNLVVFKIRYEYK